MSLFEARLNQARKGNGILFCGAGFSADCLNFDDDEQVGTGAQLLTILNAKLKEIGETHTYRDLKNAAEKYESVRGENGLLTLLRDRFTLQSISADMREIVEFPWERIYTTNYDNGIELALQAAGQKPLAMNNLESPRDLPSGKVVVHLHGYIAKWDIRNFSKSCILDAESYYRLDGVSDWLTTFRFDVDKAEFVAFVGFNASDFHLNRVLFDLTALKKKIFFINRPTASPDPDVQMTQDRFGQPLYIGRQGFGTTIRAIMASDLPEEPAVASFHRYKLPAPSDSLPSVSEIEGLFLFGQLVTEHLARDINTGKSDYHVHRSITTQLLTQIDGGSKLILISGEICDGKSIVLESLCNKLSLNRPVYRLHHAYEDLLDEVSRILHAFPNAALVIENCFDLREDRLETMARLMHSSSGILLLSSRNIAAEAGLKVLKALTSLTSFYKTSLPKLQDTEIEALIALIDQIAGWRSLDVDTNNQRYLFINRTCEGSLPGFLLRLLKSEYVRQRYQEEYSKSANLGKVDRTIIVLALYISHVGHDAPVNFLSNVLCTDVGAILRRIEKDPNSTKLLRLRGDYIQTVPAIGATNILEHMVPDSVIVESLWTILTEMSKSKSSDEFERHMFNQMMRYSILKSVVSETAQIERFFDHISKIDSFRRNSLFWLQWHMAKTDTQQFVKAEEFLEQGYKEADSYEERTGKPYNRKQLDDRRAKFLMARAQQTKRRPDELFRDMREAWEIAIRLLRTDPLTHHPFQTLLSVAETYSQQTDGLLPNMRTIAQSALLRGEELSRARLLNVPDGYQRSHAAGAVDRVERLLAS